MHSSGVRPSALDEDFTILDYIDYIDYIDDPRRCPQHVIVGRR